MTPIAKIISAHGIKGEVRIRERVADMLGYAPLFDAAGREMALKRVSGNIFEIAGANDRNAAEALRGAEIFTNGRLSPKDDPAGMPVFANGERIGTVRAKLNFGAGDIFEIEMSDGGVKMISAGGGGVLEFSAERIVVDPEHLV
jgi:ribosomal 30S subunit maturation factor RimM